MKALLQRVTQASVSITGEVVGKIGHGLVVFIGVADGDTAEDAQYLAQKTANLRIFSDDAGKFNLSAVDVKGELLVAVGTEGEIEKIIKDEQATVSYHVRFNQRVFQVLESSLDSPAKMEG